MQHFTASDGARIAYEDEGGGRPLVMLHGLMAHRGFFEDQRVLAGDFRLVRVDLRGHGSSPQGGDTATVEQLADDVGALVKALDLQAAIGVGWSLGAAVLWRILTGSEASRFAAAVVVDMTARVLNEDGWDLGLTREACDVRTAAIRGDFSAFAANAGQAIFAPPVADGKREAADWASSEFARNDPAAIGSIWSSLVDQDFRADLPRIDQPTLVVHGAHSQLYGPGTADHLARTLPNARAVRFERSGHAPHMEEPELFNRLIREFAAGLPKTREAHATA